MFSKGIIATAAAIVFAAISAQGAQAAPRDSGFSNGNFQRGIVNFRIRNQARRIRRGYRRGRLDWVEARRVRFELSHIRGFRARYLRDGWLNRREARHLHRLLDQNSRRIRRFARNDRGDFRRFRRTRDDGVRRFRNIDTRSRLGRFDGFRR